MAPNSWTEQAEKDFLIHLIMLGGTNRKVMTQIADMMGSPHTPGSLAIKFHRLKEQYKKNWPDVENVTGAAAGNDAAVDAGKAKAKNGKGKTTTTTGKRKTPGPENASGEEGNGEGGEECERSATEVKPKAKRGRKPKAKPEIEVTSEMNEETDAEV